MEKGQYIAFPRKPNTSKPIFSYCWDVAFSVSKGEVQKEYGEA